MEISGRRGRIKTFGLSKTFPGDSFIRQFNALVLPSGMQDSAYSAVRL